jgi:dihydroxyacetone kinase
MNYTGDVLNFGVAVEKAKARNPTMQIEMLIVSDDVGVPRSRGRKRWVEEVLRERSLCIKSQVQWLQQGLDLIR